MDCNMEKTWGREQLMANSLRFLVACMVNRANSGHLGMPLGMADVATILWNEFLHFCPGSSYRDRFILSCGHGSALLYSLLYCFHSLETADLLQFRKLNSRTPGHPEYSPEFGVEMTTGPLGQGLACSIGMTSPHYWTYVFCSDGDLMEGVAHEALALAANFWQKHVHNLLVFWDDNRITIDGSTSLSCASDLGNLFLAHGWEIIEIDGHDYYQIRNSIAKAKTMLVPVCIRCKTTIGKYMEDAGTEKAHSGKIKDLESFKEKIGMRYPDFELPIQLLELWAGARERGKEHCRRIQEFLEAKDQISPTPFPKKINHSFENLKALQIAKKLSTRKMIQYVLENTDISVGSADLGESTGTRCANRGEPDNPGESKFRPEYLHFGVREHGMVAFAVGQALSGKWLPVATFLSFSDYARPTIRLAAMMKAKMLLIATHDSIGVGEDGPTHQPIEQLWSLRLIPELKVFRPANFTEILASFQLAEANPSVIVCSRQEIELFDSDFNDCLRGGYLVAEDDESSYTLLATGSEVHIAVKVARLLPGARIVSLPCLEVFEMQSTAYQEQILGFLPRISIEAGVTAPWYRYVDLAFGIDEFGKSSSADDLFHLHLNPEKIAIEIEKFLINFSKI